MFIPVLPRSYQIRLRIHSSSLGPRGPFTDQKSRGWDTSGWCLRRHRKDRSLERLIYPSSDVILGPIPHGAKEGHCEVTGAHLGVLGVSPHSIFGFDFLQIPAQIEMGMATEYRACAHKS